MSLHDEQCYFVEQLLESQRVYPDARVVVLGVLKRHLVHQVSASKTSNGKFSFATRHVNSQQASDGYYKAPRDGNEQEANVSKTEVISQGREDWVLDLKSKMEEFVEEALTEKVQEPPQPRLLELYEDYKTLTGITSELITALEATIQGDMVNLENVLFSCGQQFPELVRMQRSRTSQLSSTGSPLQAQDSLSKQGSNSIERDYFATRLDFSKIKHDLTAAEATQRCLLLQALRWKLTRPSTFEQRNSVVLAFVDNDLLGFAKRTPDYSNRILHMIKSANSGLQQSFTRFLNALASFSQGRSYLSRNLQLVATLIDCLLSDRLLEPKCQDMILGILQKLSLR
ncbi:lisH domain-containing protein ARMC9 [Ixodes scapularis]